jgi:NitT/TauT family transport system permease protein
MIEGVEAEMPVGPERPRMGGRRLVEQVRYYLPTIVVLVAVLVAWELFVRISGIQTFFLPSPTLIVTRFFEVFSEVREASLYTLLREAVPGFVLGCAVGIIIAFATSRWTTAREVLLPFAIAANSIPIVAFAPIMNNWFGLLNPFSKVAIVAIIVFFPMMINTTRGLVEVDAGALELMRSYAASDFEIMWKLRVPNALPYMFNAFKVGSALSMIGAIVGEFFGGPYNSLGQYITQKASLFDFPETWAAIIIGSLLGIAFYLVIVLIERLAMPWHVSLRAAGE